MTSYSLTQFHAAVLTQVRRHSVIKNIARKARVVLMRGPWRSAFITYYQKRGQRQQSQSSRVVSESTLFPDLDVMTTVDQLEQTGCCVALQLSPEIVSSILEFQSEKNSTDIFHPHKICAIIKKIALDSKIIAVVRQYLGIEPILYASRLYYTPPAKVDEQGEFLSKDKKSRKVHFDVSDFKDLEIFIYLSDIGEDSSPHIVYEGTHKHKKIRDLFFHTMNEQEALRRFGSNCKKVMGKAGLGFFEDTSAFHLQSLGKEGRFMLRLSYTLQRSSLLAK